MPSPVPERYRTPTASARIALIAASHAHLTGAPLIAPDADDAIAALWHAPAVIVAHDTAPDPHFFFANRAALAAFEADLDAFLGMPSRLSAEAPVRDERQALLDRVTRDGFIADYAGIRISLKGRRFPVTGATVWNLTDPAGTRHGQAATFAAPLHAT